jgi:DNA ligase (NAD+)
MASILKKITKNGIKIIDQFTEKELENIIIYASNKYYNTDSPVLSDIDFDFLIDTVKKKYPKSNILNNIGAKIINKNKVKLDYWLGSMNKIKDSSNKLELWNNKYKPPYYISDKLDGVSALLIYDKDILLFTRGDGQEGQNISHLLKYINLPTLNKILNYCLSNNIKGNKNTIAFRGELIIKKNIFDEKWKDKFKNIRNTVSGVVNSKKINIDLVKDIDLVLYEIVDPNYTIDKQFYHMNKMGFNIVNNIVINNNLSFELLSSLLYSRKKLSNYDIDGIVIASSLLYNRNTDGNPDYAFAYKNIDQNQIVSTHVINIEWNVSKNGYLIPTIILNPIEINGVIIKRVTGNNAKFVLDNKIGIGSKLEIIRSGDVIPKIHKVLSKSTSFGLPNDKWHWSDTNVDIILDKLNNNKDIIIKNIYFFFSTLKAKGLGEKVISNLVENNFDTIYKIINIKVSDISSLDNFGEKSAKNIITSIKKSLTNIDLSLLMTASGKLGRGIGIEKINSILNLYPNLLNDYKKWSEETFINNIKKINGWEDKTSSLFVNNFDHFIDFYNEIKKFIILNESIKKIINKGKLLGMNIVLSGFRDNELMLLIENSGGIINNTLTKSTNLLVIKDDSILNNPTGKVLKAQEFKIDIMTKSELLSFINN